MSAANFCTMEDFPLFVIEDKYYKECPCCGMYLSLDEEACPDCGESMEDVSACYDSFETQDQIDSIENYIKKEKPYLEFFNVTVQGGYYTGAQLYVEERYSSFPESFDNEDCHMYFECCRSRAIRKYEAEKRKVEKFMRQIAAVFGLDEYYCGGVFSNGEAVYHKVPGKNAGNRERIKYALAVT